MTAITGWGRYPRIEAEVTRPASIEAAARGEGLPRGNGRSYGDASLAPRAVDMMGLDRLVSFDDQTGLIVCEAGLMLSDLIDLMLPRGWFVPVTPGTKLVTIGGMVASDVHGKNHHGAGTFGEHVAWLDLALGDGRVLRCSRDENADLFAATIGGMGLTGIILTVAFAMIPVETAMVRQRRLRAPTLVHAFAAFEESLDWTYSVAWIDCLASGKDLGRSAILLGEHALAQELPAGAEPFARPAKGKKRVPIDMPGFVLGRLSVTAFNKLYYAAQRPGDMLVPIDPYFWPLDAILEWNRIYGRGGFVQYQCVLPIEASAAGYQQILAAIAAEGDASFLAVLKRMGPQGLGMLSFPMEGYTLALDFPANARNLALLDRLDAITVDHGGRIYLAKDARASVATIAAGYPRLDEFRDVRRRYGLDARFSSLLSERLHL
ncbi:FAD/FMN-containing dehydrogenase [Sphingomonas jinjuensis]|uniref:FAD/FMN-containing dehydrogenase n=1 Tax=Sphingomonas jinjuensis TaxID=535907 RepID=A0A840FMD6_9SPHN|nr:FAD-binding oxidoreductase [Sphingomonas jinjuensis]MBB4154455.1 FAD/FMN-containing dehydrogenase [Sphingomonas jinjuensis]